jgi:hypothetical protein
MRKLILALVPMMMLADCRAAPELVKAAPTNSEIQAAKPGDPLSPLDKDGKAKPSFPNGEVVRLNAIVQRSKDAIDEFDKQWTDDQAVVSAAKSAPADASLKAKAAAVYADLGNLHKRALAAKADLAAEEDKLKAAGQYYDTVIYSGMALFVGKVEAELAEAPKELDRLPVKK